MTNKLSTKSFCQKFRMLYTGKKTVKILRKQLKEFQEMGGLKREAEEAEQMDAASKKEARTEKKRGKALKSQNSS